MSERGDTADTKGAGDKREKTPTPDPCFMFFQCHAPHVRPLMSLFSGLFVSDCMTDSQLASSSCTSLLCQSVSVCISDAFTGYECELERVTSI
jgi:hypothetical protein